MLRAADFPFDPSGHDKEPHRLVFAASTARAVHDRTRET